MYGMQEIHCLMHVHVLLYYSLMFLKQHRVKGPPLLKARVSWILISFPVKLDIYDAFALKIIHRFLFV